MLRHGGAPIWTALTVKTGEITGISFPTAKVGPGPIRTLIKLFAHIDEHHGKRYSLARLRNAGSGTSVGDWTQAGPSRRATDRASPARALLQ